MFLLKGVLGRVEHEVLPHAAQASTESPFISPSALIISDAPMNTQARGNPTLPESARNMELTHADVEAAVTSQPTAPRVNRNLTITSSKLIIIVFYHF